MQKLSASLLKKEKSAAAIVMDIHNGDILALSSVPGFDPNEFVNGLSSASWRKLTNDPYTPLINKAISGLYAPGSTFKMIVALAALEANIISPKSKVTCRGYTELGEARFHCWKKKGTVRKIFTTHLRIRVMCIFMTWRSAWDRSDCGDGEEVRIGG